MAAQRRGWGRLREGAIGLHLWKPGRLELSRVIQDPGRSRSHAQSNEQVVRSCVRCLLQSQPKKFPLILKYLRARI